MTSMGCSGAGSSMFPSSDLFLSSQVDDEEQQEWGPWNDSTKRDEDDLMSGCSGESSSSSLVNFTRPPSPLDLSLNPQVDDRQQKLQKEDFEPSLKKRKGNKKIFTHDDVSEDVNDDAGRRKKELNAQRRNEITNIILNIGQHLSEKNPDRNAKGSSRKRSHVQILRRAQTELINREQNIVQQQDEIARQKEIIEQLQSQINFLSENYKLKEINRSF